MAARAVTCHTQRERKKNSGFRTLHVLHPCSHVPEGFLLCAYVSGGTARRFVWKSRTLLAIDRVVGNYRMYTYVP